MFDANGWASGEKLYMTRLEFRGERGSWDGDLSSEGRSPWEDDGRMNILYIG